jgi:hypothetical protein
MIEQERKRMLKVIKILKKHKNANLDLLSDKARIAEDILDELQDDFKQERGL